MISSVRPAHAGFGGTGYSSAASKKSTPAANALSMMATLAFSSDMLPKVIVPRQISDTVRPVFPRRRCFMVLSPREGLSSANFGASVDRARRFAIPSWHGLRTTRPHRPQGFASVFGLHELRIAQVAVMGARRRAEPPVHPALTRARFQFLRHRRCLFTR